MHSLHPAPVQHTLESHQAERAGGPLHPSQPCHTPFSLGLGQLVYRTRLGGCCEGSTPFDCPLSEPVDRNKLRMMLKKKKMFLLKGMDYLADAAKCYHRDYISEAPFST